jgi:hypothetical protein
MEKRPLANLLGMRPETLTRAFSQLVDLGAEVDGASLRIVDKVVLAS